MATKRNLQFYGFAYGDTPVTLDVKINGQQVFLSTVTTIAGDLPQTTGNITFDQVLFEVNDTNLFPIGFSGHYDHSVEVSGGNGVLLGPVCSNYMKYKPDTTAIAGNATGFLNVYDKSPANSEGTPDVRSSVTINGIAQVPPCDISTGTWTWQVDSGSNLSCNLNISTGNVAV